MSLLKVKVKKLFFLLLFMATSVYAMTTPDVSIVPDSTNTYSQYTITAAIFNANSATIRANLDSLRIRFNSFTTVPASINPAYITVNNTAANALSIKDSVVSILSPVNIQRGGSFTIIIRDQAHIKNPAAAGDYYLYMQSNRGPDANSWEQSAAYTVSPSNSNVSAAAVTPDPSIATEPAQYTVGFNLGISGALTAGSSTITIAFPVETSVPNGSISGVTVNGTSATTTASSDTVYITTPVNVDNQGSVEVVFLSGAGLTNPAIDSSYTLAVKTSSETNFVTSDPYAISPAGQLSITAISSKPDTVNEGGAFSFNFRTGSSGALVANTDTIYVIFPQNTYLPVDMSPDNVSITSGGFSNSAASIIISKSNSTDADTVAMITPININNSSDVTLNFDQSAGYLNPSIAGNYTLSLKTSKDQTAVSSNPYSVVNTNSLVSTALVTPTSNSSAATTSYTIDFNLGRLGRLVAGSSTISLDFDDTYTLSTDSAHYAQSTIAVAEGSSVSIPWSNLSINTTTNVIQVTIPESVEPLNSDNIVIYLAGTSTQPITNPNTGATGQNYTLWLRTSVEGSDVPSATYNIGGAAITIRNVALADSGVNNMSQYTFSITTALQLQNRTGQGSDDYVTIIFPDGTVLPSTIPVDSVTLGGNSAQTVQVNQSNKTVIVVVETDVGPGDFDVVFLSGAGVRNPVVPSSSFYKVTMSTSLEQAPVTSSAYNIGGNNTQTDPPTLSVNPSVINANSVVYTVSLTTSSSGKIAGGRPAGSSTVTVNFDTATVVPASISASTVQINGTPLQSLTVDSSGAGGVVTLVLPNGLTVDTSATAQILFTSGAGLSNGGTAGTYKAKVKTSSDTLYSSISGTDGDYSIASSQSLAVNSVLANPSTQNNTAAYSINFNVGSLGALAIGDTIWIDFPSNTYLPPVVITNDITVNGTNPTINPTVSGDTLLIISPVAISNLGEASVLTNQAAGILNPTLAQSYTLNVFTNKETSPYTSPSYNISQTSTTVSAADVTVTTPTPSPTTSAYTIQFNVGANGRLISGTSTIDITFDSGTGVSAILANYTNSTISVNGGTAVNIASNIAVSSKTVTVTIPSTVSVNNSDQISIYLADDTTDPITNPTTEGSHQLQVRTSVETSYINSNSYNISSVGAVTINSVTLSSLVVNANSSYTISITTGADLTAASSDQIIVTFPSNTFVPATISASNVTVGGTNAAAVTTNPSIRSITITIPNDIGNGSTVSVVIASGAGLENPSNTGNYTLDVSTTAQPVNGTSGTYTLQATNTFISNFTISVDPAQPSVFGKYTFSFQTGANGRLISGSSDIFILFPEDIVFTQLPLTSSRVTVNSTTATSVTADTVYNNYDTLRVTVPSSVTIGNNTNVTVVIDVSASIRNASTTTALTYQVYTSVENTTINGDHSLPVELSSFSATSNEGTIRLNWVTESELKNAYWIIDRCEIPKEHVEIIETSPNKIAEMGLNFNKIRRISGAGTVSQRTEYMINDSSVVSGRVYAYRLTDVSYNGVMTRHDVVVQRVETPDEFSLAQNYPNPFNPQTTIPFRLKSIAEVQIKIYDILGQEIVTLVNGSMEAGYYKKVWDGKNNFDHRVSSGIYFYLLTVKSAGGEKLFRQAKKMMLLK